MGRPRPVPTPVLTRIYVVHTLMKHTHELDGETFEWDTEKAAANRVKHGVSFESACEVFFDRFLKSVDASNEEDIRDAIIGYDATERLLFVVFIERDEDAIRIISARPATKHERSFYEHE